MNVIFQPISPLKYMGIGNGDLHESGHLFESIWPTCQQPRITKLGIYIVHMLP